MYNDGERKTVSEMQREAEATRAKITQEVCTLERIKKSTAKVNASIDQLFRLFAREAETPEDRLALISILESKPENVSLQETVPLLPIALAMANGKLMAVRSIDGSKNRTVNDGSAIFLAHVLRFSPHSLMMRMLDISDTEVGKKGLCFLLEAIVERGREFTLIARRLRGEFVGTNPPDPNTVGAPVEEYAHKFSVVLDKARHTRGIVLHLDPDMM